MSPGQPPRPAVLCILDGWGFRTDPRDNAILDAKTPTYDKLIATCPEWPTHYVEDLIVPRFMAHALIEARKALA